MRKLVIGVLVLIVLALMLPACSSSTPTATKTTTVPSTTPQITTTTSSVATTTTTTTTPKPTTPSIDYPIPLNPNAQHGGTMIFNHNQAVAFISAPADGPQLSQRIGRAVFEPLLICDAKENIGPWLATSVTTSADGKAVTFKLRQGVKFHDGTDFNAQAVKFNLEADLKNNIASSAVLKKIVSYDIPDPYTITLNLSAPDATLLLVLAQSAVGLMASPTAQQKPTTPDTITQVHCVGTGPFMLDSWQRDNYVQFKANPDYWQKGKPYLDVLRWNFVPDFTASLLAFRSGQADVVLTLDPVDMVALKKEGYAVGQVTLKMYHYLTPDGNNKDSPFAKLEVRQALDYALNRNELIAVGGGYFFNAYEFASPGDGYFDDTIAPRTFDLAKVKTLLASAGYPNGVQTLVVTNQSIRVDTENLILAQLKAAGFNVIKEDKQTSAAYSTTQVSGWKSSTAGVASLLMPGFPNPGNTTSLLSRFNTTQYPDQYQIPGLIDGWVAVQSQIDTAKRNAQIKTLLRQVWDNAAVMPYQYDSSRFVCDSKAQGWAEYYYGNNSPDFFQPAELWMKTK